MSRPDYYTDARQAINLAGGLIGIAGMAAEWGVSQQRAGQLSRLPDFPEAIEMPASRVGVWLGDEVREWKAERDARYGRD